ncbi:hypothetical protein DIJ69_30645 [Streptomyces globisporus]|nr:hypothetical protein DIJ69_30645 [Streptomyces globisporus]
MTVLLAHPDRPPHHRRAGPGHCGGPHCEAGDVIASDGPLPGDVRPGDLIAVPVAGAYQESMAAAYNLAGRPPVIAVHRGTARPLIRRETQEDLSRRDVGA